MALADREGPDAIKALLALLRDPNGEVRFRAAVALRDREGPGVTEALLGVLNDPDTSVRAQAVHGLAGREAPGVIGALLGLLGDPDDIVRQETVRVLSGQKASQALLGLARELQTLNRDLLIRVVDVVEELMARHYGQLDPADQLEVRAATGSGLLT